MVTFNEGDPTGEYTETVMQGLREIEGVQLLGKKLVAGNEAIVDWQNHDPDSKFESAVSIDWKNQQLLEATIRFGPVATYDIFPKERRQQLEADWADVVLDASMATRPQLDLDGRDIDLGDMYISDYARPHVRIHRNDEGYETSATKLIAFIRELNERHKRKFGTLEDRLMDPQYNDILELR